MSLIGKSFTSIFIYINNLYPDYINYPHWMGYTPVYKCKFNYDHVVIYCIAARYWSQTLTKCRHLSNWRPSVAKQRSLECPPTTIYHVTSSDKHWFCHHLSKWISQYQSDHNFSADEWVSKVHVVATIARRFSKWKTDVKNISHYFKFYIKAIQQSCYHFNIA